MKRILIYMLLLISYSGLYSQGLYNNGAKITVSSGAYLTVAGNSGGYLNVTSGTDGSLALDGTLKIEGDVTNNAVGSDLISSATSGSAVILAGAVEQTLTGTSSLPLSFKNLTVNNTNGIALLKDVTVSGVLTLTSGRIKAAGNNFTFGPAATVAGTLSASNMIVATGTGEVRKQFSSVGTFTFPVGSNTGVAQYSPVNLNFASGTFGVGAYAAVNVVNSAYSDPYVKTSYLNRYWNVSQSGITGFSANAAFNYVVADVVGTESQISATRISPTPIVAYGLTNVAQHQLTANGLSSFGTFTGVIDQTTKTINLTSVMLEGLYNGGGTMRQAQDAVGAHWPAGIADHITVELHNSTTYATVVYTATDVALSTTGTATVTVPGTFSGNYYITIKHRNSLETTSATAVSFAGNTINQSYGTPANVFGGNLVQMIDSYYAIFAGDVNQDGVIDTGDMTPIENDSFNFMNGYLNTDINGDGVIDTGDMINVVNNSYNFVGSAHP